MKKISLLLAFLCSMTWVSAQNHTHTVHCNLDGFDRPAAEKLAVTVTKIKTTPSVVAYNATGNIKMEATLTGTASRVTLVVGSSNFDFVDNGTNGDATAGDNIYTLSYPASSYVGALQADDAGRPFIGYLDVYEGATLALRNNMVGQVRTAAMPNVTVRSHGANKQATDYVFNIVGVNDNTNSLAAHAQQFYQHYPDNFDFLHFLLVPGFGGNRFHGGIRNTITGIGLATSNNGASWGSAAKAIGYNVFPVPSFYDGVTNGYIHEIGHQWINFTAGTPFASGTPHWPQSNVATGVMGYSLPGGAGGTFNYTFTSQTGGYQFAFGGNPAFPVFNKWELYLMGLTPKTDVNTTAVIFKNQASVPAAGFYANSDLTLYTINELVATLGERNPTSATSQKAFKAATIIASDALLTADELAYYDFMTRRAELTTPTQTREGLLKGIGHTFFTATGGLGTLSTRIFGNVGVKPSPVATTVKIVQNTEGGIFIETDDIIERVSVTNLIGQVLVTGRFNSLAINNLQTGIYIISVQTNRGFLSQKIFKK